MFELVRALTKGCSEMKRRAKKNLVRSFASRS